MIDTTEVREHIMEMLLNDEMIHEVITTMAMKDLQMRGLGDQIEIPKEAREELVCMGQTRFLSMILSDIISYQLG